MGGKPWTSEEDELLYSGELDIPGRSRPAVWRRRINKGITKAQERPWSAEEDKQVFHLKRSGYNSVDIARQLNRSPGAVRARDVKLCQSKCPLYVDHVSGFPCYWCNKGVS